MQPSGTHVRGGERRTATRRIASIAAPAFLGIAGGALLECSLGAYCVEGEAGCIVAGCHDGLKNGGESDVDCGGECDKCEALRACSETKDCATRHCVRGVCCDTLCPVWSASFGSLVNDAARAAALRPDGSIVVVGQFFGAVDFGGGPLESRGGQDAFVLALGADGGHLFSERFGGEGDDAGVAVVVTPEAHVLLMVDATSKAIDFGGGVRENHGTINPFLVELDPKGKHVWSKAIETTSEVHVRGFARASNGDLFLSGSFYGVDFGDGAALTSAGGLDVFVARLDGAGKHIWSRRYGSVWHDTGSQLVLDADDNLTFAASYSRSWSFGGPNLPWTGGIESVAIAKLSSEGALVWSHGYGGGDTGQFPTGLASDAEGNVYVLGIYAGEVDFGTGILQAGVSQSAFVTKYSKEGEILWAKGLGDHTASVHSAVPNGYGGLMIAGSMKGDVDFGEGIVLKKGLDSLFVANLDEAGRAIAAETFDGVMTGQAAAFASGRAAEGERVMLVGGFREVLRSRAGDLVSNGAADAFVIALER